MTAIILSLLALGTSIPVALKRREHWVVFRVLLMTAIVSIVLRNNHEWSRAAVALCALIPLSTALAYVELWRGPAWATPALCGGYAALIAFVAYVPDIDIMGGVVTLGPIALSVCVGLISIVRWWAGRERQFVRELWNDGWGMLEHVADRPPWSMSQRVAALWLGGDVFGLWMSHTESAVERLAWIELALVSVVQVVWLLLGEIPSVPSTRQDP